MEHPVHLMPGKPKGFTLTELLVALSLLTVLAAFALPSFRSLLGGSEMTATANTLVHSLQLARSEAIKRSQPVALCTSNDSLNVAAVCDAGASYQQGWIVYVDDNINGSRDAGEALLLQVEERSNAFQFAPDVAFAEQIYFNDVGASANAAGIPLAGQIGIDYANGLEQRIVRVAANGRISTEAP